MACHGPGVCVVLGVTVQAEPGVLGLDGGSREFYFLADVETGGDGASALAAVFDRGSGFIFLHVNPQVLI